MSKYGDFAGPHFPVFGLKSLYSVRIQEIRTIKNSVFGHFSRSVPYYMSTSTERLYTVLFNNFRPYGATEACLAPYQISMMEHFSKIMND